MGQYCLPPPHAHSRSIITATIIMSQFELVSQFTEDAFATEDHLCERPACQSMIAKGAPCLYVATIEPGKPGRHVCSQCYALYQTKAATSVRPVRTAAASSQSEMSSIQGSQRSRTFPDSRIIRQTVNAAQRKSTINPPPVVAVSQAYIGGRSMRPVGPEITVPSSWGLPQDMTHANRSSGASSYSENHANYGAQRERWAKLAYALPPMDTITLDISAVHEGGVRKKGHGVPIGNIRKGKRDVDARINAPGLIEIAFDTVLPKILTFGAGFPWRIDDPIFFFAMHGPEQERFKPSTFKTKQFALMVVVPEAQWNEYEDWVENSVEVSTHQHALSTANSEASGSQQARNQALRQPDIVPSTNRLSTSIKRSHARRNLSVSTVSSSPPHKKLAPAQDASPDASFGSPKLAPAQVVAPPGAPPGAPFRSPNRNDLMQALRSGGTANLDIAQVLDTYVEHIQFYLIPTRPLADILKNVKYRSFILDSSQSITGQLTVNASTRSMLGAGGFKTAHPGWLSLTPLTKSGLGSIAGQPVAVKRPFHKVYLPPGSPLYKIGRFALADEIPKLFKEANVLYWSNSLLELTYAFIDRSIASSTEPPPFNIPRIRFVDAGLALSYSQRGSKVPAKGGSKAGSSCGGYLVEEFIEGGPDEFVKFIHNMDSNPLLDYDDYRYELALFFAFTQHVQYIKTGGLAFILDYQDPNRSMSVGEGEDLFGDGNLECTVRMFEKQHKCNVFCEWPGFGLEAFVDSENIEEEEESEEQAEEEAALTTT
ncbi:hypothetical protein BD769DRAFT_1665245 [Suillus cothurnatus]|nr:hypothetical protein BD769DRAFT_1665245 [Suillus cothurnatus]